MIDNLFLWAVGAIGWGLSLATYRFIAKRRNWPMGALQIDFPAVPILLGLIATGFGIWVAVVRGFAEGGVVIGLFGLLLAIFWTGFLRVGSQISLILAPLATALLIVFWLAEPAEEDPLVRSGDAGPAAVYAANDASRPDHCALHAREHVTHAPPAAIIEACTTRYAS